jgi:hypothetical protein
MSEKGISSFDVKRLIPITYQRRVFGFIRVFQMFSIYIDDTDTSSALTWLHRLLIGSFTLTPFPVESL